jgi:acyl-CoA hydrolase
VLPEDTNAKGTAFGGRVLSLIDKCAAIAAMRHARTEVVTVSMDSVVFLNPVRLGNVLTLCGRLNAVFGSSMEAEVEVHSEDPLTGEETLTTTALVTLVAVDEHGRPRRAAVLEPQNDNDRRRAAQAASRRSRRLAARTQDVD